MIKVQDVSHIYVVGHVNHVTDTRQHQFASFDVYGITGAEIKFFDLVSKWSFGLLSSLICCIYTIFSTAACRYRYISCEGRKTLLIKIIRMFDE